MNNSLKNAFNSDEHKICIYNSHDQNGFLRYKETLTMTPGGDLFLIREEAEPLKENSIINNDPQETSEMRIPLSAESAITWMSMKFPPQVCMSITDIYKPVFMRSPHWEERTKDMDSPLLQFRFSNMRLEIIFDGTVYSYMNDEALRSALFNAALGVSSYRSTDDKQLREMILQQIRDSLSRDSTEQQEYHEDPADPPTSFFSELLRTILHTKMDPFTREFENEHTVIHFEKTLSFDPVTGQSYPLLPIIRGMEDGLYYTVITFAGKETNDDSFKEEAFDYFLNTDGYPYWADLCADTNEVILLHRLFFDFHYDEYQRYFGKISA